jgi:cysteine sulfinate desulfinase/cysteine desulfurase-like protein
MGIPSEVAEGALRFSLGKWTTDDEVEAAAELVVSAVQGVQRVLGA